MQGAKACGAGTCPMLLLLMQMRGTVEQQLERKMAFVQELKCLPVAVQTAAANEQHYEVWQLSSAKNAASSLLRKLCYDHEWMCVKQSIVTRLCHLQSEHLEALVMSGISSAAGASC